ncbi:MAG: polysaccharide biosynthesis/export family protein [Thermodesulfobacteriota bacterium]
MKTCALAAALTCWLWMAAGAVQAAESVATGEPPYIIGYGDVLEVVVWKNQDLSRAVTVLPDGTISLPLLGELMAAGKTAGQLKKEIEGQLVPYMAEPVLSVIVKEVNSFLVFVIGKVTRPGSMALHTHLNVLQALAMAGGLNAFAKGDEIKIFRTGPGGGIQVLPFDYDTAASGENLTQNIRLERGDIIVVP